MICLMTRDDPLAQSFACVFVRDQRRKLSPIVDMARLSNLELRSLHLRPKHICVAATPCTTRKWKTRSQIRQHTRSGCVVVTQCTTPGLRMPLLIQTSMFPSMVDHVRLVKAHGMGVLGSQHHKAPERQHRREPDLENQRHSRRSDNNSKHHVQPAPTTSRLGARTTYLRSHSTTLTSCLMRRRSMVMHLLHCCRLITRRVSADYMQIVPQEFKDWRRCACPSTKRRGKCSRKEWRTC